MVLQIIESSSIVFEGIGTVLFFFIKIFYTKVKHPNT